MLEGHQTEASDLGTKTRYSHYEVHICAVTFLSSSLTHINLYLTVPWGVLYSGAVRKKPCRHLLLSVSSRANANLIWDEYVAQVRLLFSQISVSSPKKKLSKL